MTTKRWAVIFLIFGVLGFSDAMYLTIKHYTGGTIPCAITTGCEQVTSSTYATFAGVPVALLGVFNYVVILILAIITLDTGQTKWLRWLAWYTVIGFLFSSYLLYLQAFVLQAYCLYCLVSAGISYAVFILGLMAKKSFRTDQARIDV